MADTGERTLRLLSLLQHRGSWPGRELAERLGVSARTLRRDVDRLRALGYPVRARPGVDGGYELAPGASLPPLVVDDDEALALVVGLHTAVNQGVAGLAEPSMAALAKVVAVMPPRLRRRVDAMRTMAMPSEVAGARAAVGLGTLASLAVACRNRERIGFAYTDRDGVPSERAVEPHRIVLVEDRWYLVGFDSDRHDWRTFRIDRMHDLQELGRRFHPRDLPGDDAAAFVRAGLRDAPARHHVEAEVALPAAEVTTRIGRFATATPLGERRCRVTIAADSPDWALFALGILGADFELLGPSEVAERMREWSDRFTAATSNAATSPRTSVGRERRAIQEHSRDHGAASSGSASTASTS